MIQFIKSDNIKPGLSIQYSCNIVEEINQKNNDENRLNYSEMMFLQDYIQKKKKNYYKCEDDFVLDFESINTYEDENILYENFHITYEYVPLFEDNSSYPNMQQEFIIKKLLSRKDKILVAFFMKDKNHFYVAYIKE